MKRYIYILLTALVSAACGGASTENDIVLGTPGTPTVISKTDHSIAFKWTAVAGASGYDWRILSGEIEVQTGHVVKHNTEVTNLAKGTTFRFAVRATCNNGTSEWSAFAEESTTGTAVDLSGSYASFEIPSSEEDGVARAFPGAEGGGMYTTGGRGGKVYHVTTLEDAATNAPEGSLRWALNQSGPKTIVFDVAGIIELKDKLTIPGHVTIAGQTAPGDGICLKNYSTTISGGDVIIRFMRFRLGDEAPWTAQEIADKKADGEDCIWGRYQERVILDHCSMSWSVDECASFYANEYFTLQWSILGESMKNCKLHTKGNHGYGGIWGGKNASFHHNMLVHHDSRNPRLDHPHIYETPHTSPKRRGNVDYRNNVVYNWGGNNTYGGEGGWFNIVGNYYKLGPDSSAKKYIYDCDAVYGSSCDKCGKSDIDEGYPQLYVEGNRYEEYSSYNNTINWNDGSSHANYNTLSSSPLPISGYQRGAYVTTHDYTNARDKVCAYAGASLRRDKVDARYAADVLSATSSHRGTSGAIITNMDDVKSKYGYAWPSYSATSGELAAVKDTDGDGIPDAVEDNWGLDKNNANDGNDMDLDIHQRYTNLEMYLHYLVKDIVKAQNQEGTYTGLSN